MTDAIILYSQEQGHEVMRKAWALAKPRLAAGHKLALTIKEATRSTSQNAHLHALFSDIAKQLPWAGKHRSVECWKRLIVAAWLRARGEAIEILPALDGHGIDVVWRPTSSLTVSEASELLEFTIAWATQQGVELLETA